MSAEGGYIFRCPVCNGLLPHHDRDERKACLAELRRRAREQTDRDVQP